MPKLTQDELVEIFQGLKKVLKKYEPPFKPKLDLDSRYDLWSFKDVMVNGKKRKEIYFAGIIIQSTYVGLYYMPIYAETSLAEVFKPELLNLLKGKSCFYIRDLSPEIGSQIEEALEIGYKLYQDRDWV
jgi:hypothetical protein